ncbi:MAG: hypothetical protein U0003_05400 [Vampirovibrionales bacterium]
MKRGLLIGLGAAVHTSQAIRQKIDNQVEALIKQHGFSREKAQSWGQDMLKLIGQQQNQLQIQIRESVQRQVSEVVKRYKESNE